MAQTQHCHSGRLAAVAPGQTTPAATKRRLERLLDNDRLDPDSVWPQLARSMLGGWAGGSIVLILDETPNHNDLRCLKALSPSRSWPSSAPTTGRPWSPSP